MRILLVAILILLFLALAGLEFILSHEAAMSPVSGPWAGVPSAMTP